MIVRGSPIVFDKHFRVFVHASCVSIQRLHKDQRQNRLTNTVCGHSSQLNEHECDVAWTVRGMDAAKHKCEESE